MISRTDRISWIRPVVCPVKGASSCPRSSRSAASSSARSRSASAGMSLRRVPLVHEGGAEHTRGGPRIASGAGRWEDGIGEEDLYRIVRVGCDNAPLPVLAGGGLGGGDEARADVDALHAEGECGGQPTPIRDAASSDDRDRGDGIHYLRDKRERANRAAEASGLGPLRNDDVY